MSKSIIDNQPEIREDYDHLAAAKQMLAQHYASDDEGVTQDQHQTYLLEILNEGLIALVDAMRKTDQQIFYKPGQVDADT